MPSPGYDSWATPPLSTPIKMTSLSISTRTAATIDTVTLVGSVLTAEFFYRFHSFSLELVAFGLTWLTLVGLRSLLLPHWK